MSIRSTYLPTRSAKCMERCLLIRVLLGDMAKRAARSSALNFGSDTNRPVKKEPAV